MATLEIFEKKISIIVFNDFDLKNMTVPRKIHYWHLWVEA